MTQSLDKLTIILPTGNEWHDIGIFPDSIPNSLSPIVVKTSHDTTLYRISKYYSRLEMGLIQKTLHSTLRSSLLYSNLIPGRIRSYGWGYSS